jgi:hypothetical protein
MVIFLTWKRIRKKAFRIVFLISSQFQHALNVFVKGDMSVSLRVASSFHCLNILSKSIELTP